MNEYELSVHRKMLEDKYGEVLTTAQMQEKYDVIGFSAGMCVVTRKSDGQRGTLYFDHMPRFYYDFHPG